MELKHLQRDLNHLIAIRQGLVDRFFAETTFARALAPLEGDAAAGWEDLIREAESVFARAKASESLDTLQQRLNDAEAVMAPIGAVAKTHTIHCVGHGHIDMNWMWGWPETVAVTNDTFLTVLKLMDEFPDFRYTQSQASVYEIARQYNPELFRAIQEKVKEGRWEVAAVHWVEGDKNLASGESLTRHMLYTRRYMKEHFGLDPEDVVVDWEPDTFGHAHTIPTVIARGGVRRYYCCRTGADSKPPVFWWQGPDGSRVLVNLETHWYNSTITPASTELLLKFREKTGLRDWMQVYGIGDHGGGPTRRDIRRIAQMNGWPVFPNFKFSTTNAYYDILEAQGDRFPVLDRELNYEFTGCYTSQSDIKKANRYGENALVEAETAAALALRVLGKEYPSARLEEAWRDVLFSHFHDILPGSGVPATRTYNQGAFQNVIASTSMIKTQSLRALAEQVDTSFAETEPAPTIAADQESTAMGAGPGRFTELGGVSVVGHVKDGPRPIVVFNPTTWPRSEIVTVSVWDAQTGIAPGKLEDKVFHVLTPEGERVAAQKLDTGDYWGHQYVDIAFPVSVGAQGHAAYVIQEGAAPEKPRGAWQKIDVEGGWGVNLAVGRVTLENEFLRVVFDKATGGIIEFTDKRTGLNLASPDKPMGVLEYVLERPLGGSAWVIADPQKRVAPLEVESFETKMRDGWSIEKGAGGPHVVAVAVKTRINDSRFTTTFQLKAGQPWLDIDVTGRWVERGGRDIGTPRLSMEFPAALDNVLPRYEIPFGSITRDELPGREVPALRWASMTGLLAGSTEAAGLTLMNDSRYGHSLDGSTMRVTLLRSSYDPDPLPEIGDHAVRLAIAPHGASPSVADLVRLGANINHPLQVVNTDVHEGQLPARADDVAACETPNAILSGVKKAEDDDSLIFRLFETEGQPAQARVAVHPDVLGRVAEAVEVDLLERTMEHGSASVDGDGFRVDIPAHGIASVRVRFA